MASQNYVMHSVSHSTGPSTPSTPTTHLIHSPPQYQVPYLPMGLPGSYPVPSSGTYTGPQQAFISDLDIQRTAEAVRGIIVSDVQTLVTPLKNQIFSLAEREFGTPKGNRRS